METEETPPVSGSAGAPKHKRKKTEPVVSDTDLQDQLLGKNAFAALAQDTQATSSQQPPVITGSESAKRKLPPLVVKNANFADLIDKMSLCKMRVRPSYRVNRFGIKIHCEHPEDFENAKTHLELHEYEFYTYDKPGERPYRVVLRGLPMVDTSKLQEGLLKEHGLTTQAVHIIRQKDEATAQNQAFYLVHFPKGHTNLKKLGEVRTIARIHVRWEKYRNRRADVTQCMNCLHHGHGTRNCHLRSRCNKCGESHTTDQCPKEEQQKQCANCGGAHSATDRSCPKRADYVRFRHQATVSNQPGKKPVKKSPAVPALTQQHFPPLPASAVPSQPAPTRPTPPGTASWANPAAPASSGSNQQQHRRIDPRTRASASEPLTNPTAGDTEQPLFTSAELWAMFTDLTSRLRNCKTRAEQFDVLGYMACHYGVN